MSVPGTFDVSASAAFLASGESGVCLKIQSPHVEANFWFSRAEAKRLTALGATTAGESNQIGTSVGRPVHWSRDEASRYYVLVGEDDQTWDIALTLDEDVYNALVLAVAAA
jgi:hypothetical protein